MRLSTRGRYGLQAITYLGQAGDDSPTSLTNISKATGLSISYLEQLLRQLKKDGLVDSTRGAYGGYFLTKPAEEMTVFEVLYSVEGFFGTSECVVIPGICSREGTCPFRGVWASVNAAVYQSVKDITIQEIIDGKYIV